MYRTEANIINWHVPWKLHFIPVGKYSSYVGSIYDNRQNQKINKTKQRIINSNTISTNAFYFRNT